MHNSATLMAGERVPRARLNPADAAAAGIADGDRVRIASAHGEIEIEALVTDEVMAGTVAVPHGWGHDAGWETANAAGGANVNLLTSSAPDDLERLAGMAHMNGVPVQVAAAAPVL
jgi:formate dehydrogenase